MWHIQTWRRGIGAAVLVTIGAGAGWLAARSADWRDGIAPGWGVTNLGAVGAVASDRYAVATGPVDDEVEGLFTLDFHTGNLQCSVLNLRTSKFSAQFQTNVLEHLPAPAGRRNPRYLLTTGQISLVRAGRMARVGRSVAYVLDATTGNYAAYALQWRPELAASGRPQVGSFVLLDTGNLSAIEPQQQPAQPGPQPPRP